MNTKQIGDIAEQATILRLLRLGFGVLRPVGDRLPYDLVVDTGESLVRAQVKSAWKDTKTANYVIDSRRTKTNRRKMLRSYYSQDECDVVIAYIPDHDTFFLFDIETFCEFRSSIYLAPKKRAGKQLRSCPYREKWDLIG